MQRDCYCCKHWIASLPEDLHPIYTELNSSNLTTYEKKNDRLIFSQSPTKRGKNSSSNLGVKFAGTKLLEKSEIHSISHSHYYQDRHNHKHKETLGKLKNNNAENSVVIHKSKSRDIREINTSKKISTHKHTSKHLHHRYSRSNSSSDNSKRSLIVLYRGGGCELTSSRDSPTISRRTGTKFERITFVQPQKLQQTGPVAATQRRRSRGCEDTRHSDDRVELNCISKSTGCIGVLSGKRRSPRKRRTKKRSRGTPKVEVNATADLKADEYRRYCCGDGFAEEPCRRTFDSSTQSLRLMAQHPNFHSKSFHHKRPQNFEPDLGLLMQHLQSSSHSKGTGDNSITANDGPKKFPFQSTPSGNLKIVPNQVVFESKKVSVLVADPRHAKVNVKAEQQQQQQPQQNIIASATVTARPKTSIDLPPGVTASTVDRLQAQRKLPGNLDLGQVECRPRTQPHNRIKPHQHGDMDIKQQEYVLHNRPIPCNEVPLSTLGFTSEQPIDWKNITLPEKTDLYQELSRRITTYKNADCIVRIGHDEFHCHLLVLQSYSTFCDEKNFKEIDLTGSTVTSRAFSIIYDWMISPTSESCHLLRRDNILEIFLAAQYLGIKELEEQCWAFIDNDELFSEDTAFLLYLEARKIGNTAVMELMVPRIMKFFLMLVSTKDFLELSVEELCLLLRSNYISVNSEMEVLMSAVRWLMFDWEDRKQHLLEVMKCVRFGLIAPWQLVDVKRNPENPEFMELMSYPEIQKMVDDGLAFVIIKYWYGNQTEDYYHWIDLLGLTEPTNRNWAGEDKNYVTYREFLLYLEEYQKSKVAEIKNKHRPKPPPSDVSPKEDNTPQISPMARPRTNHQNSKTGDAPSNPSNLRSTKPPTDTTGNNASHAAPPCMMPPEFLCQYLTSVKNSSKPIIDDVGKCNKSEVNTNGVTRFSGGGEFPIKVLKANKRVDGEENNILDKKSKKKENKEVHKKKNTKLYHLGSTISTLEKKNKFDEMKDNTTSDSPKSEEEAATTIQAVYRGYKTRRKFKELINGSIVVVGHIHNSSMTNLHEPFRCTKSGSSSDNKERNKKDKNKTVLHNNDQEQLKITASLKLENFPEVNKSVSKNLLPASSDDNISSSRIETIMPPAYSNNNEESNTITPCDSVSSNISRYFDRKINLNTCGSSKTFINENDGDDKQLLLSKSDLEVKKKNVRKKIVQMMKCKLTNDGVIAEEAKSRLSRDSVEREVVLVFGGIDPHVEYGRRGNTGKDMYRYKPVENVWEFVGEMPEPRHHHSVAYLTGRIYLVGGTDPQADDINKRSIALGTVWSYDVKEKNWYSEPNMLIPRQNFGLVVNDGKMFAVGGQNKNGIALKSVEAYDPETREWKELRSMSTARIGPASAYYEGYIWVAGGMIKTKKEPLLRDVECYDVLRNIWFKNESLLTARCFSCLYAIANRLYIVGGAGKILNADGRSGVESIDSIDVWDASLCCWQHQTAIPTARHGHAVSSFGSQLIVIGGVTTLQMRALRSAECYNAERDEWIEGFSPLPFAISGHAVVSFPTMH